MLTLMQNLKYRNRWATLVFAALGAPFLILVLIFLPSPMTAMKAQFYWIIIPLGLGGTLISMLMEIGYRWHQRARRKWSCVTPTGSTRRMAEVLGDQRRHVH